MVQMLKDTLIYGLCGFRSLKPQSGFQPGVILPSENISTLSGETAVAPAVGTLLASSVIGQRDCEHPAVREAAPKEPSNINSTQSGRPRFTPTCWVAGFSLRDSLIHCPLKHPLFTPNGRSSLIYMCEVTSFQI